MRLIMASTVDYPKHFVERLGTLLKRKPVQEKVRVRYSPFVAALLALTAAPTADAQDFEVTVIGAGNQPCSEWTNAARGKSSLLPVYHAWLGGFLTGVNLAGAKKHGDLTDGLDFRRMTIWIDGYCGLYPDHDVSFAANMFIKELASRKAR